MRMTFWKAAVGGLVMLAAATSAFGQASFTITGYVIDFPTYQHYQPNVAAFLGVEPDQYLNLTRLRLRPELLPWEGSQFTLEYEMSSLLSVHPQPPYGSVRQPSGQVFNLSWTLVENQYATIVHYIDRLYFRQLVGAGEIAVGRQRIALGTGRVWNPTDLFNPISPTSFAKIEKDGVDAAVARIHFGSFTDMSVMANPENDWKTLTLGGRFRTNFNEVDVSAMGGWFHERAVLGGDFAANFFDAGLRGEAILSGASWEFDSSYVRFIAGVDYQFTADLYGLVEYQFNGEGTTDPFLYDLAQLLRGEILNVGRNYLALQCSYLIHPLVNATVSIIGNLDDRSGFVSLLVSYSVSDEIAASVGGQVFVGEKYDEYWYYPAAAYAKVEAYL